MKKTRKRILCAALCGIIISAALTSCSSEETGGSSAPYTEPTEQITSQIQPPFEDSTNSPPSSSEKETSSSGNHNIEVDTYKTQISYYMGLTESLQAELLKLKEDKYIDECEYQLKISSLEQTIQDLKDTLASITKNDILPPTVNTQTPSNDQLSSRQEFKYTTSNGEVTITQYIGSGIDISIPSAINGNPVTKIGEEAFKGLQIRSVTIPSGVKEIDWFAFSGCTTLEKVTVPSSVMSVGYGAFDYCPKSLTIVCAKGSYIEAYAHSWGMAVDAS